MSGRWSDWIEWGGGDCPVKPFRRVNVRFRGNGVDLDSDADCIYWKHDGCISDVIAYQYWIEYDKEQPTKQTRYLDSQGDDWIDEFARTATVDEFRGAMKFTIGKYLRRIGKKDDIPQELGKIRDYAERWKEYESKL